jgi:hypothetical protein
VYILISIILAAYIMPAFYLICETIYMFFSEKFFRNTWDVEELEAFLINQGHTNITYKSLRNFVCISRFIVALVPGINLYFFFKEL